MTTNDIKIEKLENELKDLREHLDLLKDTVQVIQIDKAKSEEQIKTIFQLLEKMDKNLERLVEKPTNEFFSIKLSVISATITGIIGIIVGLIVKH